MSDSLKSRNRFCGYTRLIMVNHKTPIIAVATVQEPPLLKNDIYSFVMPATKYKVHDDADNDNGEKYILTVTIMAMMTAITPQKK